MPTYRSSNPDEVRALAEFFHEKVSMELALCTQTLLDEIARPKATRNDVAKTYALALRSREETDWGKVNRAILERWSPHALGWIKNRAWSGKCFE